MSAPPDELDWIAALRPLTRGAPAALGLMDDAAILPSRPGFDLVITEDAMVEGVHFLVGEDAAIVARRLLRTNLSDLAAKGAAPHGYFLMTAWPATRDWDDRMAFIAGLAEDGDRYGLSLLGGDTVATPGPLTVSATMLGWAPPGAPILRSTARPGQALVVCGPIGDGALGLKAARGEIDDPTGSLARHYRLPEPMLQLNYPLMQYATAAADVSDGLLSDALHIAEASGCGVELDLGLMPMSEAARAWLAVQPDRTAALLSLATGGDDYALVCGTEGDGQGLARSAMELGMTAAVVGRFTDAPGLAVRLDGAVVEPGALGWRHR